jgi:hypothetical protein
LTPALDSQLGLLGSPPDPVGRFTMREGPSTVIVNALQAFFRSRGELLCMPYPKRMTELYPLSAETLFYDRTRHLAAGDPAQAEAAYR